MKATQGEAFAPKVHGRSAKASKSTVFFATAYSACFKGAFQQVGVLIKPTAGAECRRLLRNRQSPARHCSRIISAWARRAGNLVIVPPFEHFDDQKVQGLKPQLVLVDADNRIKEERSSIPVQKA
jgi:hypothetical protein